MSYPESSYDDAWYMLKLIDDWKKGQSKTSKLGEKNAEETFDWIVARKPEGWTYFHLVTKVKAYTGNFFLRLTITFLNLIKNKDQNKFKVR